HTAYVDGVLGPLILTGIGLGMVIAPSINTGTYGVAPQDAGVASATVTVGQQLGASIGTSLLNTIFASAVASYIAAHLASARVIRRPALTGLALAHGYDTAFWWTAGILVGGAIVAGLLFRPGPLYRKDEQAKTDASAMAAETEAGPPLPMWEKPASARPRGGPFRPWGAAMRPVPPHCCGRGPPRCRR